MERARRRLRLQPRADRAASVFLLQACRYGLALIQTPSLPSSAPPPPKKREKKKSTEPCRTLANYALCANSHLVSSEVFSGACVGGLPCQRNERANHYNHRAFPHNLMQKKSGMGEKFRELTKGGRFHPNIADPPGNYRGTLHSTKGVRVGK